MKSIGIDINGKELVFEGEWVSCSNNHLTSLVLNEGCKEVYCSNNQLTSLVLNEGCERVSCHNNQLTSLELNEGCERVFCDNIDLFRVNPDIEINILNFIK
jgi:hypothetical protein